MWPGCFGCFLFHFEDVTSIPIVQRLFHLMTEPAIFLDRLSKSYRDTHAVSNLSLEIAPGTIFGFLGANGAGKTTTIRMLCGLTHPTAGNATIAGTDVWKDRQ